VGTEALRRGPVRSVYRTRYTTCLGLTMACVMHNNVPNTEHKLIYIQIFGFVTTGKPVPVTARSMAWV